MIQTRLAPAFVILLGTLAILSAAVANKKPPAAPVNLNTATSEELQTVPGIGPATADKILQMRKAYGAFKSVDDLLAIKGIGPKRLEKMRKYLTVSKERPAKQGPSEKSNAPSATPTPKQISKNPQGRQGSVGLREAGTAFREASRSGCSAGR